jgi:hypothetical protein
VWDALDLAAPGGTTERIFVNSPVAAEIYAGHTQELERQIHALCAVDGFLDARGLSWAVPGEDLGAQHDGEAMREYLDAARRAFRDVAAMQAALDAYAEDVHDLLAAER